MKQSKLIAVLAPLLLRKISSFRLEIGEAVAPDVIDKMATKSDSEREDEGKRRDLRDDNLATSFFQTCK